MFKNTDELTDFFNKYEYIEKKIASICGDFMWLHAEDVHAMCYERVGSELILYWEEHFRGNCTQHTRKIPLDWLLMSEDEVSNMIIDILVSEEKAKKEEEKKKQAQMQKRKDDEDYRTYIRLKEKFGGNKNNG